MAPLTQFCPMCQRTYGSSHPFCPLHGVALNPVPEALPEVSSLLNDRYLILSKMATGGMGAIFRAHDVRARREVALKVLKPSLVSKEAAIARFFVEGRAAKRLKHPNIVELFDFGVSREGYLYLSMEVLPGGTLATLLAQRERLSVGEALLVAHGVCEALHHAHGNGVVHRDLKPENIFLVAWDQDGYFVKVLDFGIAAVADARSRGALGRGEVLGTPAYMSPEQVRGDVVDRRSDLYSLGVVLYEMLAGIPPFLCDTSTEVMRAHLSGEAPPLPPLAVSATVRRGVDNLLASLMARAPADRPTDAAEARARVRAVMDNLAVEDARAVDAALFRETLAPLRSMVPFHERETCVVMSEGEAASDAIHFLPTMILAAGRPPAGDGPDAATGGSRTVEVPWTVQALETHGGPAAAEEDRVVVTLVHIEMDFATIRLGTLTARDVFAPEMEAFEAATVAAGGSVCHDTGEEVRIVFGLYSQADPPNVAALRAVSDLLARVKRFRAATALPVEARVGVATDRVPAQVSRTASPDTALRGSTVDLAVRLARMALPGTVMLDEETRNRAPRDLDFEEVARIRVRGRDHGTRVFGLATDRQVAEEAKAG